MPQLGALGAPQSLRRKSHLFFSAPRLPNRTPRKSTTKSFFFPIRDLPRWPSIKKRIWVQNPVFGSRIPIFVFFCFCFGLAWKSLETRVRDANSWSDRSGPFQGPSRVPPGLFGPSKPSTLVAPRSRIHGSGKDGFGLELGQIRPGRPSAGPVPGRRGTMRLMSSDFSGRSKAPTFEGALRPPKTQIGDTRGGQPGLEFVFPGIFRAPKGPLPLISPENPEILVLGRI